MDFMTNFGWPLSNRLDFQPLCEPAPRWEEDDNWTPKTAGNQA